MQSDGLPRQRGGDERCPPGYPFCSGCNHVFASIDDIADHECEEATAMGPWAEEGAHHRIRAVRDVRTDVAQMEANVDELLNNLRELEWQLLGGRGMYDPERCQRLCEGTARGMESISDQIADLPDPYEEDSDD